MLEEILPALRATARTHDIIIVALLILGDTDLKSQPVPS